MDRTKTVIGAGSQRAKAQPEVKVATSKPSMTVMAGQSWVPPTNGGNPRHAFDVPQFANTQTQYLASQRTNTASKARDDHFIRSSLPKLKLAKFSGDSSDGPELTIPSNSPCSEHGRQCKDESSSENRGHRQGQGGDCWIGVHR